VYIIYRTGHPINERIVSDFRKGTANLSPSHCGFKIVHTSDYDGNPKPCISYGILRGNEQIFKDCRSKGVEFWEIDRGYFNPSDHTSGKFDGYYRITMNGMRAEYNHELHGHLPNDRFNRLGIEMKNSGEPVYDTGGAVLICPPTDAVCEFEGIDLMKWISDAVSKYKNRPHKIRFKGSMTPLQSELSRCSLVVTHNSNVIIDALKAGVAVDSPYTKNMVDRYNYFKYLTYCQFTLDEFKSGYAWETAIKLQKYGAL